VNATGQLGNVEVLCGQNTTNSTKVKQRAVCEKFRVKIEKHSSQWTVWHRKWIGSLTLGPAELLDAW